MEMTNNEPPKSKKELLVARLTDKYPDKDFSADEDFYGQIYDDFDQSDKDLSEYKDRESRIEKAVSVDPRAASFMASWLNGEDPVVSLIRNFGDDFKAALEDEDMQEKIAQANKDYLERAAKEKELEDEYENNIEETNKCLDALIADGTMQESDADDVSFTANSGEILGIAGISGCGQKELLEAIAGLQPVESGSICYVEDDGEREELLGKDPLHIAEMGVALSFVPEDRLGMGLVANMDLADNMMLRSFRRGHSFFTDRKSPRKLAESVVKELDVNTPGISTQVRWLSGGNVQKVLVGREISSAPTVLLTAYAVRGLDINSSYTIYDLINRQKAAGVAVIYVGEDLDVLLELADRILVLCGGKVSGIVEGRGAQKRDVGMMMTRLGGNKADE